MITYSLCHTPSRQELEALGVQGGGPGNGYRIRKDGHWVEIRAVATGEIRVPQEGDWYLSGPRMTEAYRAGSLLRGTYPIARLVAARQIQHWEVVE